MKVVYFQRKRGPGHFSIEKVFEIFWSYLPPNIQPVVLQCPRESRGILNRIINILWAWRNQGDINHVTGDVHYLTYLMRRRRTVLTIHDCVLMERHQGFKRWLLRLLWYRLPVARSGIVTTISQFTKDQLLKHVFCTPDKIVVIHDPYDPSFKPSPKPFNTDCPVILQMGTGWNKNLERVAAALDGIHCFLEIVGTLSKEQRTILESHSIRYANHVNISDQELYSLYKKCDLVTFASLFEGFGLPIIESQAVGRPIVTSNRCPMTEVAGGAACLVDPESVESIRQGILKVIEDKVYREELVRKGLENIERFAPQKIAARYVENYEKLIFNHQFKVGKARL